MNTSANTRAYSIQGAERITDEDVYIYTLNPAPRPEEKVFWYTEGNVDVRYSKDHRDRFTIRVEEDDLYFGHISIYCVVDGVTVAKDVPVQRPASPDSPTAVAEIKVDYPFDYLLPQHAVPLKVAVVGHEHVGVVTYKWTVDSGQKVLTSEDEEASFTVTDLLDSGFAPQGSIPVVITLEILRDGCVLSTAQKQMILNQYPPENSTKWTPNYNGVNSYVSIPEWKPTGKFEIECDVYLDSIKAWRMIIGTDLALSDGLYWQVDAEGKIPNTDQSVGIGLNKLKYSYPSGVSKRTVKYIGASKKRDGSGFQDFFKGQISNVRLTDLDNPSNSRYYPGIVYTYEDPYSPTVSMPSSTVLVDEISGQHGTMTNFGTTQPYVPLLGDRLEYLSNHTADKYVRGCGETITNQLSLTATNSAGNIGSFVNQASAKIPKGSILCSDGYSIVTTEVVSNNSTVRASNLTGDVASMQRAFQYPNTFKVIKPTDPDYPKP